MEGDDYISLQEGKDFIGVETIEALEERLVKDEKELETLKEQVLALKKTIAERKAAKARQDLEKEILRDEFRFDTSMALSWFERWSPQLTWKQLRFMVYKFHGLDATYSLRFWEQSIYSRSYCTGDISWHEYDDASYRGLLIKYLTLHSCKYCKKLSHSIETCPELDKFTCDACGRKRHSLARCKDAEALQRYARSLARVSVPMKHLHPEQDRFSRSTFRRQQKDRSKSRSPPRRQQRTR